MTVLAVYTELTVLADIKHAGIIVNFFELVNK